MLYGRMYIASRIRVIEVDPGQVETVSHKTRRQGVFFFSLSIIPPEQRRLITLEVPY